MITTTEVPFVLSMVVAATDDTLAIGRDNTLLWHLPEDLKYFKNLTWGKPVVMGRKTFESIGKPLPGRLNVVLTQSGVSLPSGVASANTVEGALSIASEANTKEVFIIGGAQIYNNFLPLVQRIYLTRVYASIPDADTFFPTLDWAEWAIVQEHEVPAQERQPWKLNFEVWERK